MSASVNQIMYPNVKFPTPVLPSHPTASKSLSSSASLPSPLATPLALLPDFRPEQAFLRSIRPFLSARSPAAAAEKEDEESALSSFNWHDENLTIDWRGIAFLTLRYQVLQPWLTGLTTFFGVLLFKEIRLGLATAGRFATASLGLARSS